MNVHNQGGNVNSHQIGVEALNNESPQIDVEVISMAMALFKKFECQMLSGY